MEPTAQIMKYLAERFTPKPVYAVQKTHNAETAIMADTCGICCTEVQVYFPHSLSRLSWGQPLFTLGWLPLFTLSLEYFLPLLRGPSTNIDSFIYFKIIVFEGNKYWLIWKRLSFAAFFSCFFDALLDVTYANIPVATQWPLRRVPYLQWLCVMEVWMRIGAICAVDVNAMSVTPSSNSMFGTLWPDGRVEVFVMCMLPWMQFAHSVPCLLIGDRWSLR